MTLEGSHIEFEGDVVLAQAYRILGHLLEIARRAHVLGDLGR